MLARLLKRVGSAFWFVPATCVVAAAGLALALVQLDEKLKRDGGGIAFAGGPESARSLLSAIASSMLSLTALVFSITVVVLQLTSSQFSPRVLRTFLRDRQNQLTLGVFTATFVYALIALREVRGQDGLVDLFVPGITISVAFGLVLVSVALFVAYIHHIVNSIRVVKIVDRIRIETESTIDRLTDRDAQPVPPSPASGGPIREVPAARSGAVVAVDVDRLVRLAAEADIVLRVVPQIGEFVPEGAPLLQTPVGANVDDVALVVAVQLDIERDTRHDVAFGVRQLVDIAERALSPGINDPTTAVQCLDQLHALLRRLGTRTLPTGAYTDRGGTVRLIVPTMGWDDYVALALDEIRHWGSESLQVHRRLRGLLGDLLAVVDHERRPALRRQLALLDERATDLPPVERPAAAAGTSGDHGGPARSRAPTPEGDVQLAAE